MKIIVLFVVLAVSFLFLGCNCKTTKQSAAPAVAKDTAKVVAPAAVDTVKK